MKNTETVFYELQDLLQPYAQILDEAVEAVINQNVSNYPILVTHEIADVEIGLPIIAPIGNSDWSMRISTLEEFVVKQIITNEKLEDFRKLYKKQTLKNHCLFVLPTSVVPNFLFLPKK